MGEVLNLASGKRKDNYQNQTSSIFKDFQDKRCLLVDKATLVPSVGLSEEDSISVNFKKIGVFLATGEVLSGGNFYRIGWKKFDKKYNPQYNERKFPVCSITC